MFDITPMLNQSFRTFATAKNADTIEMDGKEYRCIRRPNNVNDFGEWEFLYKGEWHKVLNYQLRKELNKRL